MPLSAPLTAANSDPIAVSISILGNLSADKLSVVVSGILVSQHLSKDGTTGVYTLTGTPLIERHNDVSVDAVSDAALATLMTGMLPLIQAYIVAKGK